MAESLMLGAKFEWNENVEQKFNEVFDKMDKDHNGRLTFDEVKGGELERMAQLLGFNPIDSELKAFIDKIDLDGDGAISRDEFMVFLKDFIAMLQDPVKSLNLACDVMFRACDIDKNGKISKEEFKEFMADKGKPLKDSEIEQLFTMVDRDLDTTSLTKEELLTVLVIGRNAKRQQMIKSGQPTIA